MEKQICEIEKSLFSSIQSEYYKLDNILKKKKINKEIINTLNNINYDILALELKIKQLRLFLLNGNEMGNEMSNEMGNEMSNEMGNEMGNEMNNSDIKDIKTIEKFKPLMIYYRMMLDYTQD